MNRSSSIARSCPSCSSRRCRGSRKSALRIPVLWRASAPTRTFSSAVIEGNSRMFWNVRAMPIWVISNRFLRMIDSPWNRMSPLVGR